MNRQTQDNTTKRIYSVEDSLFGFSGSHEDNKNEKMPEYNEEDYSDQELSQIFYELMNLDEDLPKVGKITPEDKVKEKRKKKDNPCNKREELEHNYRNENAQNSTEVPNQNESRFCNSAFQNTNQFTVYNANHPNHQYRQYYSQMAQPLSHPIQMSQNVYSYPISQFNPGMPYFNNHHQNVYNIPVPKPQIIVPLVYPQSFYYPNPNNIYQNNPTQVYPIQVVSCSEDVHPSKMAFKFSQKNAGKFHHPTSEEPHLKPNEVKHKKSSKEFKENKETKENNETDNYSGKSLATYVITSQGSRRVQKQLINNIKDPQIILKEILNELPLIITSCYGMQFFQTLIKLLPMESRFSCWKSLVANNLLDLVNNEYGNLSTKSLIECVLNSKEEDYILSVFRPYFTKLAYTMQGSDILQTIVFGFSDQSKKPLIDFIEDSIFSLVYDSVGSLLVLKTIESMVAKSLELKLEFINILYQQSTKLVTDANGSHILIKLLEEWGLEAFKKFYNLVKANILTYINLKYSSALIIKLLPKLPEVSYILIIIF